MARELNNQPLIGQGLNVQGDISFYEGDYKAARASYEQAQRILAGRGVLWQKQVPVPDTGEWDFSCALPNRQNPNFSRIYTARAPDLLGALRAVLDKIDKEQ